MRAITDMNEINFHLIECAYVHKCILNGPVSVLRRPLRFVSCQFLIDSLLLSLSLC